MRSSVKVGELTFFGINNVAKIFILLHIVTPTVLNMK